MSECGGKNSDGSNADHPDLSFCSELSRSEQTERCSAFADRRTRFPLGALGKIVLFLFLPLWIFGSPNTTNVLLYNDSPFILTAIVQASDGSYLGQFTIQPGQQRNFTTNLGPTNFENPGRPDISLTPFSVVWQCPSEGFFSLCTNASPGSLVRASDGSGPHFCSPKPSNKKEPPASSLQKQ